MRRLGPQGLAAAVVHCAFLAGCGQEQVAGGGGIETNNTVAARVVDASLAPVEGAEMVVRPSGWSPDQTGSDSLAFRGFSDAAGRVEFSVPRGDWTIEVRSSGTGSLLSRRIESSGGMGDLVLRPMGRLRGVVYSGGQARTTLVGIRGTRHAARPDSTGAYQLDSLPPGRLDLVVVSPGATRLDRVDLPPSATVDLPFTGDSGIRALDSAGWIRLDDFRSASPAVAAALPGAHWTLREERPANPGSFFQRADSGRDSVWGRFLVAGNPPGKASFQGGMRLDFVNNVIGQVILEMRLDLVDSTECLDLTTLGYLRVGYTATAQLTMQLLVGLPDSLGTLASNPSVELQTWNDWKTLILDSAAFSPGALLPPGAVASRPLTWTEATRCVQGVKFRFLRNVDFGIYDLSLYGVSLPRLMDPRPR